MPMNKRADKVLVEKNAKPRKAEARTAGEERRGGKSQINDENAIKKSLKLFFRGHSSTTAEHWLVLKPRVATIIIRQKAERFKTH